MNIHIRVHTRGRAYNIHARTHAHINIYVGWFWWRWLRASSLVHLLALDICVNQYDLDFCFIFCSLRGLGNKSKSFGLTRNDRHKLDEGKNDMVLKPLTQKHQILHNKTHTNTISCPCVYVSVCECGKKDTTTTNINWIFASHV